MQKQEIEIAIGPDGKVEYTIRGVAGSGCESISALLEKLGQVQSSERTSEWYLPDCDNNLSIQQSE